MYLKNLLKNVTFNNVGKKISAMNKICNSFMLLFRVWKMNIYLYIIIRIFTFQISCK